MLAHFLWSGGQLLHREIGHDENEFAADEAPHESYGMLGELVVLAAPDH
jgi:hypothetical protein